MEFDSSEFRDFGQGDKDSMTDIGALYASLAPTILVSSDEEEAEAPARGSPRESCTEPNESVEDEALPSSCQSVQEAVPGGMAIRPSRRWKRGLLHEPENGSCPGEEVNSKRERVELDERSSERNEEVEMAESPKGPRSGKQSLLKRLQIRQKLRRDSSYDKNEDRFRSSDAIPEKEFEAVPANPEIDLEAELEVIRAALDKTDLDLELDSFVATQAETVQESKKAQSEALQSDLGLLQPELMTDEELSEWMQFFGLKPSSSRDFMIRRLHDIVDYLDGGTAFLHSIREAPTPHKPKRARKEKTEKDKTKPETPKTPKKAKAAKAETPRSVQSASSAVSPPISPEEKKFELIAEAIRKDKELYESLLTFQPLEVSEVKRRIVAVAPELRSLGEQRLRKYLDSQGFASTA